MGPLETLWQALDNARHSVRNKKLSFKKTLHLAETSVLLLGQVNVAIKYLCQLEIIDAMINYTSATKKLVQQYMKYCDEPGKLFGRQFQTKMAKDKGPETIKGLGSLIMKCKRSLGCKRESGKQFPMGPHW